MFSTSIPGDRIYSHQFAAELEAVGKGAEAHVKHTFPVNEASAEWQPPDLGIQAQSLHNSRTSWEGIDWSFLPTPLPAVPYPPSTRTNSAWKYKVLRINYCRTLNLVCFLVDCEESGLDQGSLTITEASGSQTWLRTRITWEFKKIPMPAWHFMDSG